MKSNVFCDQLKQLGYDFFTGVPDSTMKGTFQILEADPDVDYVVSVNESLACGIAFGAAMAGRKVCMLMQNSGFGEAINALASLSMLYASPTLIVVGWRGHDGKDAIEHLIMGRTTLQLMDTLGLPYVVAEAETFAEDVARAAGLAADRPAALIIRPGMMK
ncbi:Putative phosphonopyruvate decarboxylase or sulfopyruvate decarboxylase, alpha subunit [Magnetospirillum sp. XM-1]|uniref:thiamine pyrophosphate-binding protein n=1 Tax=Magnetospirillum sp. XM-1 TaxID=1663591 RepID=UPI00073E0C4F|nr:thiamine pyrophosphate-binding protein [Magnetospirillum sp. XM-1]CUW38019.1 Putative phosphonopyruvate decarboxylase or sulfopyruvate decarboxylase, alpha subunit [Magnetospirillum sp. XM-1]